MRKTKRLIAQFTFYDRTGIEALLEKQAEEGWLLEKISSFTWELKRIEPKKIHYAVTYFPKASAFDPEPSEEQLRFREFCEHTGWKLAGATAQLQIFYNEAENPVPIETDPQIELENIHTSAKKAFLPSYFMLLVLALMQIGLQIGQLVSFPLTYLVQDTTLFNWLCQGTLLIMCSTEIIGYYRWYHKAKAAAENGAFVETKGSRNFQLALLGMLTIALVILLLELAPGFSASLIWCFVILFGYLWAILGIKELLKRMKVDRAVNRTVTITATVILSIVVTAVMSYSIIRIVQMDIWEEKQPVDTYQFGDWTYEVYHDSLPLTCEDLIDTEYTGYSYEAEEEGSLMLSRYEAVQWARHGETAPDMNYSVYTVHFTPILDWCVDLVLDTRKIARGEDRYGNPIYEVYETMPAAPWGADRAWQMYFDGQPLNEFVLCYGNRIVKLNTDWEMTAEMMAIVSEKLGK